MARSSSSHPQSPPGSPQSSKLLLLPCPSTLGLKATGPLAGSCLAVPLFSSQLQPLLPRRPTASAGGPRHTQAREAPAPEGHRDPTAPRPDPQAATHRAPPASAAPKSRRLQLDSPSRRPAQSHAVRGARPSGQMKLGIRQAAAKRLPPLLTGSSSRCLDCKVPGNPEHRPRLTGRPWPPRPTQAPSLHRLPAEGSTKAPRPAACLQAGPHPGSHRALPFPGTTGTRLYVQAHGLKPRGWDPSPGGRIRPAP